MTRAGNELILAWTDGDGSQQVKAAVAASNRADASTS